MIVVQAAVPFGGLNMDFLIHDRASTSTRVEDGVEEWYVSFAVKTRTFREVLAPETRHRRGGHGGRDCEMETAYTAGPHAPGAAVAHGRNSPPRLAVPATSDLS